MIKKITIEFPNLMLAQVLTMPPSHYVSKTDAARESLLSHSMDRKNPEGYFTSRISMKGDILLWQGFMRLGGEQEDMTKELSRYGQKIKKSKKRTPKML